MIEERNHGKVKWRHLRTPDIDHHSNMKSNLKNPLSGVEIEDVENKTFLFPLVLADIEMWSCESNLTHKADKVLLMVAVLSIPFLSHGIYIYGTFWFHGSVWHSWKI